MKTTRGMEEKTRRVMRKRKHPRERITVKRKCARVNVRKVLLRGGHANEVVIATVGARQGAVDHATEEVVAATENEIGVEIEMTDAIVIDEITKETLTRNILVIDRVKNSQDGEVEVVVGTKVDDKNKIRKKFFLVGSFFL